MIHERLDGLTLSFRTTPPSFANVNLLTYMHTGSPVNRWANCLSWGAMERLGMLAVCAPVRKPPSCSLHCWQWQRHWREVITHHTHIHIHIRQYSCMTVTYKAKQLV